MCSFPAVVCFSKISYLSSLALIVVRSIHHHGPPKINCWQDPLSPSQWKEEHFVIVSLTGWGLLFYGGYKLATGGKKEKKEEVAAAPQPAH
ncbi:unnamed protein product [Spirodela intermedia]|uniref:Uncharacterized protein n=1 Tax=Spirodela intermedia TaxID=51605 RepID=A0A7I8IG87_SPIIN|nr:unnamed protein product [Spirodela intermedia]CAA6656651.1 unnamed protein product [Spirodela intermedia]